MCQVQSVCFSPDGEVIVAGTVTGKWVVLDSRTREVVCHHQDGAEPLTFLSFSPDGSRLALISRAALQVYRVEENYLQANSLDREVMVVTASLCRIITDTEVSRNISWASSHCLLSWATLGLWADSPQPDITTATSSQEGGLLVAGADSGQLRLFSHPASQPQCGHHQYGGHSSAVSSLAFLADQSRLVSVGGKDAAILQWRIE